MEEQVVKLKAYLVALVGSVSVELNCAGTVSTPLLSRIELEMAWFFTKRLKM